MRKLLWFLAIPAALSMTPVSAQDYEPMISQLEQSMADAQTAAIHEGDDSLSCEQLESEIATTMQDPAVQSAIAQNGAAAQQQMDQMNAAQGRARAQIAANIFLGLASSFIPGFGYAQMAQQRAMAAQQQRQAQQNVTQMLEMMQRMQAIMPQMMRSQRVFELAQARQCGFAQQQQSQTDSVQN